MGALFLHKRLDGGEDASGDGCGRTGCVDDDPAPLLRQVAIRGSHAAMELGAGKGDDLLLRFTVA